jgi:hypothetical protein
LIASPAREAAREAVQKEIANPEREVDDTFLLALEWLYLGADPTEEQQNAARAKAVQVLIAALPSKRGEALGSSVALAFDELSANKSTPPELDAKLRDQIIGLFGRLHLDEQMSLLSSPANWEKFRSAALIPGLKKLATAKQGELKKREEDFYSPNDVSPVALQRWYELAPEEARPVVLQEITNPQPRYGARMLGFLPDQSLPEVDSTLADNLSRSKDWSGTEKIVSLIVRYATPAMYRKVAEAVDKHPKDFGDAWAATIFAYLLKVNPTETGPRIENTLALLTNDQFPYDPDFFGAIAREHYDAVWSRWDFDTWTIRGSNLYRRW